MLTHSSIVASVDPVTATHTGCKTVFDHARNKTDEELKAIAEKGGHWDIHGSSVHSTASDFD